MYKSKIDISETGITELDTILNGGFPKGSIILLSGNSGTGKTVLATQWLYNGAGKYGEAGIYFALTEPISKVIKNASSFSFYKSLPKRSSVHLTDLRSTLRLMHFKRQIDYKYIQKVLDRIENLVDKTKAKRIVIDSITALCYILEDKNLIRNFIFRLGNTLSQLNCTTILSSEVSDLGYSVFGVEEFICDGIIELKQQIQCSDMIRTLQIAKMRGVSYNTKCHKFKITKDGVQILTKIRPELNYPSSKKFLPSGINGLDVALGGGFFQGSNTLVVGPAGTGKSLFGVQFLYEGLKRKEPGLLVSFEESKEQILRNAGNIGCDFKKYLNKDLLALINYYPETLLPEEHAQNIIKTIDKSRIKRCVIDSLSTLFNNFSENDFRIFIRNISAYLKVKGITTVFISAGAKLMDIGNISESQMSTLTDNIILLKHVEISDEMKLMISVLKTRGTNHDRLLRRYIITDNGVKVGEAYTNLEGVTTGVTKKVHEPINLKEVDKKIESEFKNYIGPKGSKIFSNLKKKELTKENVLNYIDKLIKRGIVKKGNTTNFKQRILTILEERDKAKEIKILEELFKGEE